MTITLTRNQLIALGVAAGLLLIVFVVSAFQCSGGGGSVVLVATDVDAGPGERLIDDRLDAAVQTGMLRIEEIEEKFDEDLAAFDARQREEYERLRGGDDLEAAARMLSEWNRARRER